MANLSYFAANHCRKLTNEAALRIDMLMYFISWLPCSMSGYYLCYDYSKTELPFVCVHCRNEEKFGMADRQQGPIAWITLTGQVNSGHVILF